MRDAAAAGSFGTGSGAERSGSGGREEGAGAAGARERLPRHSRLSLAAEEGKRGASPAPPAGLGLAPAARPLSIGRARRCGASPLAGAVLDTKFKVFKKRPARAGCTHCLRRRWRGSAGERGVGSELRREPLRGCRAPRLGLRRGAGSDAPRLPGQGSAVKALRLGWRALPAYVLAGLCGC